MMEFIKNSAFFGAMISLIAYEIGLILKKKFKMAIFNPLLISIICVIGVLLIFHIDYDDYNEGGKYISYLLTPATVCLAVPLYEQIHLLKKNLKAVVAGIFSGTLAGLERLGAEFTILREVPPEDIRKAGGEVLAEGIRRLRAGEVVRKPGSDGEYGKIELF